MSIISAAGLKEAFSIDIPKSIAQRDMRLIYTQPFKSSKSNFSITWLETAVNKSKSNTTIILLKKFSVPTNFENTTDSYLHNGIWSQDLLLYLCFWITATHTGKVSHGILCWYSLASTRLSRHDDALVLVISGKKYILVFFFLIKGNFRSD